MAIERKWTRVSPVSFISTGTSQGKATIVATSRFKVKMEVVLKHPTQPAVHLEVKRIESDNVLYLGKKGAIDDRVDLSLYDNLTTIEALEQNRPSIPEGERDRATYEEEPTNAQRVVAVDRYGRIKDWEVFEVVNDPSTHDPTKITMKLKDGTVVRELDLEYDSYGDLIKATKTVP
jgi:hypothetical protein